MKKVWLIIFFIILCFAFSASISFAFIIKETISNNVITFGDIIMELLLTTKENNIEKNVDDNEKIDITYNSKINRNIKIKNIGKHPLFVRVTLNLVGTSEAGNTIEKMDFIDIVNNSDEWIYKDNWYYFKNAVNENDITEELLLDLNFNIDKITSKYPGSIFTLDINAEAVQAENNNKDILEVVGWPSN